MLAVARPVCMLALLAAACSQAAPPSLNQTATAVLALPTASTQTILPGTGAALAKSQVDQAQAQLARKLNGAAAEISLVSVQAMTWPDASLGCPRPGEAHAPMATPGYQIVLEARGQVYTFHTDQGQRVILCGARGPDEIFNPP